MSIRKEIPELIEAGIITQETADRISQFYLTKKNHNPNRLVVVFGALGAILVGLGIILILAHNWDELSRMTKTIFAFMPLIVGQLLTGYALLKKSDSSAWRESAPTFLFFAIGASMALVAQIYNIPGNLGSFLMTWMLLSLPLVYLLRSSMVALLYILGVTYYVSNLGYFNSRHQEPYMYWLMILLIIPYGYLLYKRAPKSNALNFFNWLLPLSITIALGTLAYGQEFFMFVAYFALFGLFYLVGHLPVFEHQKLRNNGYRDIGSLGTVGLLLFLSFDWVWEDLRSTEFLRSEVMGSREFLVGVALTLLAIGMLIWQHRRKPINEFGPISYVFILFYIIFLIGMTSSISVVLINILVFVVGILTIREGAKMNSLGVLNYGLLIIAALVACRFFDQDLSFVIRGIMFVAVGAGFFLVNYWMVKKRKIDE